MFRIRPFAFDWIALAIIAAVPVAIFWQSATSLEQQGAASGGPLENAAFYPRVIAVLLAFIVAVHVARLGLGKVQTLSPLKASDGTRLALVLSAVFVAYLLVLPYAGFHIVTPVLLLVFLLAFGVRPVSAVPGAIGMWLVASFVFEGLLNVVLPVGVFNITLFS
ncbi:tripartite tricarboxylate transporter TctB family protein [uncultured Martelella sp.]|uniref:tripartite tricarboxylate transporter TctB family protein n=1 Tax=uncultured Martelella sp. TaxID=392331 RepID=UPI0029C7E789|nr:tripartite tricarboxylate transporter TctB family protein [uncultured Martelella sp.]